MQNSFEFAEELKDSLLPPEAAAALASVENADEESADPLSANTKPAFSLLDDEDSKPSSRRSTITHHPTAVPFMSLATFRMVVLADELLESFFSEDLTNSWHLEPLTEDIPQPKPTGATGRFANFVGSFITDENKEYLGKLADDLGKRLDIQQIEQKPSLGRLTGAAAMQEPQERPHLSSTSKSRSPRLPVSPPSSLHSTLNEKTELTSLPSMASLSPSTSEKLISMSPAALTVAAEKAIVQKALPDAPADTILGLGMMDERPRFAIDDAGDDDDLDDEDLNVDDDNALMNGMYQAPSPSRN